MRKKEFPYTPLGRIAKKSGAKRISDSALKAMRNMVLEEAEEKARDIVTVAEHSGRKTVLRRDVTFVLKKKREH
ncbi:MAG: NFYB/HAP3 family transcription factor subunit [Candidatus Aenigmarchaeota archaeon]|nr:NFYB/HAP3 family transcription factor subunit [Candidatus Aenigmarchaeota archaeon]